MGRSRDVRFVSSGVKLPSAPAPPPSPAPALLSAALPFAHIGRAIDAAARRLGSCLPRVPVARADPAAPPPLRRHGKDGGGPEERVLISEVAVRGKDGEPLERAELEAAAAAALRACRPNAALTVREVQEDVHRIVESGLFRSCMPVAVDTRDGIRLVFEVLLVSSCCPRFLSLFLEI
jgi:outer membrane protein insertion porin family